MSAAIADDCVTSPVELSPIIPKKCLQGDFERKDLDLKLKTPKKVLIFCKSCTHPLMDKYVKTPADKKLEKAERSREFGKTIIEELQKELTPLTLDLEAMNSSFELQFDPTNAVKSCNFRKNLRTPTCLSVEEAKEIENLRIKTQNAFATEVAQKRYQNSSKTAGLFTRGEENKSCNISDVSVLYSYTKYSESLLTPSLINKLIELKIPDNTSLKSFIDEKNLEETLPQLIHLQEHPLFKTISKNTTSLNTFLKKIKSANPPRSANQIVEELYSEQTAKAFSTNIATRCEEAFQKASKYLDEVYCKENPTYVADDLASMQANSRKTFRNMTDEVAETEMLKHCSEINSKPKDALSFSIIRDDINKSNDPRLAVLPLENFKSDAYENIFGKPIENMCLAKANHTCDTKPKEESCQMLKFYEATLNSKPHQDMLRGSNPNINSILGSLFSEGVPQTADGKPDTQSIADLKKDGILRGGASKIEHTPQPSASTFHKMAESNIFAPSSNSTSTQPNLVGASAPLPEVAQAPAATNQSFNDNSFQGATKQSASTKDVAPERSGISNQDQDEILRRLQGRKNSATAQTPDSTAKSTKEDDSFQTSGSMRQSDLPTSFAATAQATPTATTPVSFVPRSPAGVDATAKATIDKVAPDNGRSYKKALLDTQTKIAESATETSLPSGTSSSLTTSSTPTVATNLKDSPKSDTNVKDLQAPLEVILGAKTKELSVAKDGDKILVNFKNFKIDVVFNKAKQTFEAICPDKTIPTDYLDKISTYFNSTLRPNRLKELGRALTNP